MRHRYLRNRAHSPPSGSGVSERETKNVSESITAAEQVLLLDGNTPRQPPAAAIEEVIEESISIDTEISRKRETHSSPAELEEN